jgi:hypothetical protein
VRCANCIRCRNQVWLRLIANCDALATHFTPPFQTTRNEIPRGGRYEIAFRIGSHYLITYRFWYVEKVKRMSINSLSFLQQSLVCIPSRVDLIKPQFLVGL